jgi:hypothetical protein
MSFYLSGTNKAGHYLSVFTNDISYNTISYQWYAYTSLLKANPVVLTSTSNRLFLRNNYVGRYLSSIITYDGNTFETSLIQILPIYNEEDYDYKLTLITGLSNLNSLFTTSYFIIDASGESTEIVLDLSQNMLLTKLNEMGTLISKSKSEVHISTFKPLKQRFFYRLIEIIAVKIFGHAGARSAILNDAQFYKSSELITKLQIAINNKKDSIFEYYKGLGKVDMNTIGVPQNFNFININIEFPFLFDGFIKDYQFLQKDLITGPNVGGNLIINGQYNIPLLVQIK